MGEIVDLESYRKQRQRRAAESAASESAASESAGSESAASESAAAESAAADELLDDVAKNLPHRMQDVMYERALSLHEHGESSRALEMLVTTGQVSFDGSHYVPTAVGAVDTGRDPPRDRALKAFFSQLGTDRAASAGGNDGLFSYNLFTVSAADLQRLQQLHRSYFRELRGMVAASEPAEHVVVTNMQLFALGATEPEGDGRVDG